MFKPKFKIKIIVLALLLFGSLPSLYCQYHQKQQGAKESETRQDFGSETPTDISYFKVSDDKEGHREKREARPFIGDQGNQQISWYRYALELKREEARKAATNRTGCLKAGTKILMADMTEKAVEALQVGDMVLGKDLQPTKVLGVTFEFLMNQKFYGFEKDKYFFTDTHLFVGPDSVFSLNVGKLYIDNPLMKYLNVREMESRENQSVELFYMQDDETVSVKSVKVYEDPRQETVDTLVYLLEVDSPSGTYFANGFLCRHEIPPVEHWPNTMAILFQLLNDPLFNKISKLEYSLYAVSRIDEITSEVAFKVQEYMINLLHVDAQQTIEIIFPVMNLGDVNFEESVAKLFSTPTLADVGFKLYAKVSVIVAPYLDEIREEILADPAVLARVQHQIYNVIKAELEQHLP